MRVFPRCLPKTIPASTPQCIDRADLVSRHPGSTVRSGCTGCRCCFRTSHYRLSTSRPSRGLSWLRVNFRHKKTRLKAGLSRGWKASDGAGNCASSGAATPDGGYHDCNRLEKQRGETWDLGHLTTLIHEQKNCRGQHFWCCVKHGHEDRHNEQQCHLGSCESCRNRTVRPPKPFVIPRCAQK